MQLDLTDLRLFVSVADAGTITAGARTAHLTLAAASERIQGMEAEFGAPLLWRGRRGVRLTAAGETLLHHARQMLDQAERLRDDIGRRGPGLRGHLRLLGNTSAIGEHLPAPLAAFLALHPGLSVDLEERPSAEIAEALRQRRCGLGVLSDAVDLDGLHTVAWQPDPLVAVVARTDALAHRRSVGLADLLDSRFVGLASDSALGDLLAMQARRLGGRINHRIRVHSFEAVCRLAGLRAGVAIVPKAVAKRYGRTAGLRAVALVDPWAARTLRLAMRAPGELLAAEHSLASHLLGAAFRTDTDEGSSER